MGAAGADDGSGRGGLRRLVLRAADGARAELYAHGAHLTSWVPAGAGEQLFVSARSAFRSGAAIRGGVPVIFPQFGAGPLPKHGFARTAAWEVARVGRTRAGAARAVLTLTDSAATRAIWPESFGAELAVEVAGRTLAVSLGVENRGSAPLRFTAALHTYLAVADAGAALLEGLAGVRYRDQAAAGVERVDGAPAVRFTGEVDRLYVDAPPTLRLHDVGGAAGRTVAVRADGFPDAVVWNPGPEKARALPDLADDEYRGMVCVEAAAAARPVELAAGARWAGVQTLTLG